MIHVSARPPSTTPAIWIAWQTTSALQTTIAFLAVSDNPRSEPQAFSDLGQRDAPFGRSQATLGFGDVAEILRGQLPCAALKACEIFFGKKNVFAPAKF